MWYDNISACRQHIELVTLYKPYLDYKTKTARDQLINSKVIILKDNKFKNNY